MCGYVANSSHGEFTIATETGLIHTLQKANPGKLFHALSNSIYCPNMKKGSLLSVKGALEGRCGERVMVDKEIADKAIESLRRMLELSK
jgi:quinolinate synthase